MIPFPLQNCTFKKTLDKNQDFPFSVSKMKHQRLKIEIQINLIYSITLILWIIIQNNHNLSLTSIGKLPCILSEVSYMDYTRIFTLHGLCIQPSYKLDWPLPY